MEGFSYLLNPIKEATFSFKLLPLQSFVTVRDTDTHPQEDLAVSTVSKGDRLLVGWASVVFAGTLGEREIKLGPRKAAPWSFLALLYIQIGFLKKQRGF